MDADVTKLIIIAIIVIATFLLLREFNCWYWKINEITLSLKEIVKKLDELAKAGKSKD